jgi:hypothetical protein
VGEVASALEWMLALVLVLMLASASPLESALASAMQREWGRA